MTRDGAGTADTVTGGTRSGQVLSGKYRLIRLLGRGGMGEVYEARHLVVGRRFAVKFLHAPPALGSGAAARFLREAQAAGALESPHIAAVIDFDVAADGAPFMVMEYLSGESLARLLRRERRLPVPRVIGLLLQACAGLRVAHAAGIVHRDLKPDNLFLVPRADATELLKIVDFGIAKLLGDAASGDVTQSGAVLGTPYYMAPEQARGERKVDERVDVHALGVIAYELLSGSKPHPGDSYNAILAHILTEPVRPLGELSPGLPRELVAVIERAMAFEPALRHARIEALASDLARFARQEIQLRGEAVDLADVQRPSALDTSDDTNATAETPGTLQTAVGDVARAPASAGGRNILLLLGVAAAAGAGAWMMAPRASAPVRSSAGSSAPDAGRAQAQALPQATQVEPLAAASAVPAAAASRPAPSSARRLLDAPRTRPSAASAAPGRAARAPVTPPAISSKAAGQQVTFDEQNPY